MVTIDQLPTSMSLVSEPYIATLKLMQLNGHSGFTPEQEVSQVSRPEVPAEVLARESTLKDGKAATYLAGRGGCYLVYVVEADFIYIDLVYSPSPLGSDVPKFVVEFLDYFEGEYPDKDVVWVEQIGDPAIPNITQHVQSTELDKMRAI